ncbi:hypothetical protein [Longimicrobium sp.]|uniref:hypothetical protein n=1 Tax=Longimicrobium sp. TaxID=2029185 RepID=UPI003B3A5A54
MDDNDRARFADGLMPEEERGATMAHIASSPEEAELLADVAYMLADLDPEGGAITAAPANAGERHADDEDTGTDPKVVPLRPPSAATRPPQLEAAAAAGGDYDAVQPPVSGRASPGTDAPVVPLRPPSTARTWRRAPARWVALAAVLAGVLLVPLALSRSGSRDPGDFATLLTSRDAGLPTDDWVDRPRWPVNRGGGTTAADLPRSAKLGALQVDLEVAAAAGEGEQTSLVTGRMIDLLDDVAGSGPLVAAYGDIRSRAAEPGETLVPAVAEARESLASYVDEDYFNLGAWAEAAGIAAERRDAEFFHARASRKLLDRAASLPALEGEAQAAIQAIRAAAEPEQPDWPVLKTQTIQLLQQIAG